MLKVLIWQVSNDTSFKDKAIKILEEQHNGIEIVGEAVNENIAKVDWGGESSMMFSSSSAHIMISMIVVFRKPDKMLFNSVCPKKNY